MPDEDTLAILLNAAVGLARTGGRMAAERIGRSRTSRKPDRTFLTQADIDIQNALLRIIARDFGDHAVLAEEEGDAEVGLPIEGAEYCWVVDPLDGTRNFSRGLPIFATSVAVMHRGHPVVGAVCDAMSGRVFAATVGRGATLDGHGVTVEDRPPTGDTIIFLRGQSGRPAPAVMHRWVDRFALRNIGSAALHLALVASGCADAAYARQCKLWDVAAGAVLISEAGGVITSTTGTPLFPCNPASYRGQSLGFLAAGPKLHAHLLAEARACDEV